MSDAATVVERMFAAVRRGDLEGILACLHEDVETIEPDSLAFGGKHRGITAFRDDVLGAIMSKMELGLGRVEMLEAKNKVAVSMDLTFTSRKTRAALELPYVEIYTVEGGLIRKIDIYPSDTKKLTAFWDQN